MAGAGLPQGGIPLPTGATTCVANPIPLPSWLTTQYFNPGCTGNLNLITTGSGFGPSSGSGSSQIPTDSITLITVNPLSQLSQFQLASITPVSTTANKVCCFAAGTTSVTITVNAATNGGNPINGASTTSPSWVQVVPGQLIMLTNTNGSCVLAVNSATATTITFQINDSTNDPLHFNQFPLGASSPTGGTIGNLQTLQTSGNVYPATYAYQLTMTTYYLDNNTRSPLWMLMKQVGTGYPTLVTTNGPQAVAMGINVLQFAYSCSSIAGATCGAATDPTRSPVNLYNIRKVNMWLTAIADHRNRKTGTYYTNSLGTSVVAQNLAYYNKYGTEFGP
jgi:hypothetical protein